MAGLPAWRSGLYPVVEDDSDDEFYSRVIMTSATQEPRTGMEGLIQENVPPRTEREGGVERATDEGLLLRTPTYDAWDFRRRFRMRRSLFEFIVNTLVEDDLCDYFVQRPDATGLLGFLPKQKVTCALRMLAYGASADQLDELSRIGESTALEALKTFCGSVIRIFGPQYLRKLTQYDLEALLAENATRGFLGMIGSLDCMHWTWKNCPTAWAGAFRGKEKASTLILEAVASRSLWIWHAFIGTTGSNNDLNVLERSPLLDDTVNGEAPQVHFSVNGATYGHAYYLTDGIYPQWAVFQQSISAPSSRKRRLYAALQESVRKDVERAFGVLQQRFRILALPCKLWNSSAIGDVMIACIILHNMMIEEEVGDSTYNHDYLFEDGWVSPAPPLATGSCPVTNITQAMKAVEDDILHYELKNDLIEHM